MLVNDFLSTVLMNGEEFIEMNDPVDGCSSYFVWYKKVGRLSVYEHTKHGSFTKTDSWYDRDDINKVLNPFGWDINSLGGNGNILEFSDEFEEEWND